MLNFGFFRLLFWFFVNGPSIGFCLRQKAEDIPQPTFQKTGCRLLINEINMYSENPDGKQYVELSRYCQDKYLRQKSISMKGFKLIFVSEDGFLEGLCNLDSELIQQTKTKTYQIGERTINEKRTYWLYLIGDGYENIQFNRSDCQLRSYGPTETKRFPLGMSYPIMIALVYNKREQILSSIQMDIVAGKYVRTKLTVPTEFLIMKYMEDAYIFGSKTAYGYCKYFDKYYKYKPNTYALLRDWNVRNDGDYSLSRCSKSDKEKQIAPFEPKLWRYTPPTPGEGNSCKNGIHFRIENVQTPASIFKNASTANCVTEVSGPAVERGLVAFPNDFQRELESQGGNFSILITNHSAVNSGHVASCSSNSNSSYQPSNEDSEENPYGDDSDEHLNVVHQVLSRRVEQQEFERRLEASTPYIWSNCSKFSVAERNTIENLPGKPIMLQDITKPEVCNWFKYDATKGLFRCRLCNSLLEQGIIYDKPSSRQITGIMKGGVMSVHISQRTTQNRHYINDHVNSIFHRMTTRWYSLYDSGFRSSELQELYETSAEFKEFTQSTNNLISAAIYCVKLGLPYRKFQMLLELLNFVDVDVGFKHQNFNGIKIITEIVSETIHQDMLKYLKTNSPALTILLDGTTDIATMPVLAILFQYDDHENGMQIRLYRILKLDQGESGQAIFNGFKAAVLEDGIADYVKYNLQSVTSDGAPNIFSKFNKHIEEFANKPILKVWCQNHLYDLIYKKFVKKYAELTSVSKMVNKCYCIFSKSAKAKALLEKVAAENGIAPFVIKRTHAIRWVSSNVRAFEIIFTNWEYVVITLERIVIDKNFQIQMRDRAVIVLDVFKTPSFLTSLAVILEISRIMAKITLKLETKGTTLISKSTLRTEFRNEIDSLRSRQLDTVTELLRGSKLIQGDIHNSDNVTSLNDFETREITYKNKPLGKPSLLVGSRLFELQSVYVQDILGLVDHYYPTGIHESYEVFNPMNLPITPNRLQTYGISDVKKLNTQLGWGYVEGDLLQSWRSLITKIVTNRDFSTVKCLTPEAFWNHFLGKTSFTGFNNITIGIIKKVLTVSSSNAESERFLSMYSGVKTYQRYLLAPKTVESILRVKTNLVHKISQSQLNRFSKEFILSGHSRADEIGKRKLELNRRDWDLLIQDEAGPETNNACDGECEEGCIDN